MQFVPDACGMPGLEATPTGHTATASHLLGKIFPRGSGDENEENACQGFFVAYRRTSSLGGAHQGRKNGFDDDPKSFRKKWFCHNLFFHSSEGFVRRSK
jgi:hypothetical protein